MNTTGQLRDSPGEFLRISMWFGLLGGAIRSAVFSWRSAIGTLNLDPTTTVWTEPIASAFWMCAVGIIFALCHRVWPRLFTWRNLLVVGVAQVIFAVALNFPRVHWAASAVFAVGIGYQAARWIGTHPAGLARMLRATLVPGLCVVLMAAGISFGLPLWRDRQALRADAGDGEAPNVLLVILDTVRSWNLSTYGYSRPTSPALSEFAARGVVFTRAMSPSSWTLPSHASLFTGRWPHELSTDWFQPLDDRYPTLAELLGGRGYLTAGFCANTHYCSAETGLARGFAHYEDYRFNPWNLIAGGPLYRLGSRVAGVFGLGIDEDRESKRRTAPIMVDRFLGWLDGARPKGNRQPFFAFINFFDAHRPYTSSEEWRQQFSTPGVAFTPNLLPRGGPRREWDPNAIQGSRDAYDASIAYLDHELGRLFRALDQRGLLRNTIVVVTSDHGEEFGEHGMIGHANGLYRPSVMVPLVLVAPGVQPRRVNTPVSIRDVSSTLLDLLAFPEHPLPGHSLARFWMDSAQASTAFEPVITTLRYGPRLPDWYPVSHGPVRSILDGRWRYIVQRDGAQELYDFEADSLEQNNLAATDPGRAIASRLRVLVDSLARDRGGPR